MGDQLHGAGLKPADYASSQEVRWCPGCGDYAILKAVRKTMADVGASLENTLVISGIGCAARFPYYMATYGFHTIHGRAPTIASGAMLANPDLDVWIITGDGDALAIGGNHFIHLLRRNFNCQILLFNNEIYGLTKGQYSPTSRENTRSPSTPMGSVDTPLSASHVALGAGGRFVARAVDTQQKQLVDILTKAYQHKGTSFVEIFQNCIVYNDGVFDPFTDKKNVADHQIYVEHQKPMIFGADSDKGIIVDAGFNLKPAKLDAGAPPLIHDETNRSLAFMLAEQTPPDGPMVMGVLYQHPNDTYQTRVKQQIKTAQSNNKRSINGFLRDGTTWTVK
ncbi:MAG: 2-oxoacid:ferredoxin oxidoreductase subunit beta [bacterium]|nr:2-oxoacid:ferredoxin oxidoreductase subunit beta [bacterium]